MSSEGGFSDFESWLQANDLMQDNKQVKKSLSKLSTNIHQISQ